MIDCKAQQYGNYLYLGCRAIIVYRQKVDVVRVVINAIGELGKQGVLLNQDPYSNQANYSFTQLNDIKPDMIEEATKNAREVAEKFAKDSQSSLGKIKRATQGQFSIYERDSNTPSIKKARVVYTIQYYFPD